ncbi:hypothetical protein B0H34DRAFT_686383 [Crassisporium funariophilum]|nr:hypothetical protein B0H34DRAFT_686383 [Crassisporium funariophilum]
MERGDTESIHDDTEQPADLDVVQRCIKDPIHDYIPIHTSLSRFIDTKQFQRLRHIKQLGTTSYVWPGGSHTRFEHCLGVAYLARLMADHFKNSQPELRLTDRDVSCVEIAGLCHDLGHGPWSHVWDGLFIPVALKGKQWKHEEGSEMMFDYLVRENDITISVKDQLFIKALIAGDPSRSPDEKPFLFDIVANRRNGLDVDKFDYIHRDSHMVGEPIHLSLVRLVNSARVLDNQICYDIKDANHLYEICNARFKLHKIFYNHKSAKAIEYMIIDALLAAEPHMHIAERVFDPEEFLYLTDDIMPRIQSTREPELAEARAIFDRIDTRNLYKCVDYKAIAWPMRKIFRENVTPKRIVEAARALSVGHLTPTVEDSDASSVSSTSNVTLEISDVIVDFATMHYGMKEKNPLDFVRFYSKRRPNQSDKAQSGDYSGVMPQYFAEDLLRVYTKKSQFFGLVQAGYRAILASMPDQLEASPPPETLAASGVVGPTPPATEAPSTPTQTHSRTGSFTLLTGGGISASAGGEVINTPFSNNSFTTVPPSFAPRSPSQGSRKLRRHESGSSLKRLREELETGSESGYVDGGGKKKKKQKM